MPLVLNPAQGQEYCNPLSTPRDFHPPVGVLKVSVNQSTHFQINNRPPPPPPHEGLMVVERIVGCTQLYFNHSEMILHLITSWYS